MSMNLHVTAVRQAWAFNRAGHKVKFEDNQHFSLWQTPTADTYRMLHSGDPAEAYKKWVLDQSEDEKVDIYADDDWDGEGPPIRTEIVNYGKEHVENLDAWIATMKEQGYTVEFAAW